MILIIIVCVFCNDMRLGLNGFNNNYKKYYYAHTDAMGSEGFTQNIVNTYVLYII